MRNDSSPFNQPPGYGLAVSKRKAPNRPVVSDWCDDVRAALKDMGFDQEWLAKKIGSNAPLVSYVLNGKVKTSSLVEPISRAVGVQLPEFGSKKEQSIVEDLREIHRLSASEYERVADMIARVRIAATERADRKK